MRPKDSNRVLFTEELRLRKAEIAGRWMSGQAMGSIASLAPTVRIDKGEDGVHIAGGLFPALK
jgi:hypothetical protein